MALNGDAPASGRCNVRIDRLVRSVTNLARAIDFYVGALGFETLTQSGPGAGNITALRLGEECIDLHLLSDDLGSMPAAKAPDPRFQHAAIVTRDIDRSWRRLAGHGAAAISVGGPQRLPPNTGGVAAYKFRDPDGHPLELIEFPAGVGDPRWHSALFDATTLGIDHFALVVESVAESEAFFVRLGFEVVARGINRGLEQDRLDGLDGVEVDVVALKPAHGIGTPHLELLRYRRPLRPQMDERALVGSLSSRSVGGLDEIVVLTDVTDGPGHRFPSDADASPLHRRVTQRISDPDGHRFMTVAGR